jgi:hypothetical protein
MPKRAIDAKKEHNKPKNGSKSNHSTRMIEIITRSA